MAGMNKDCGHICADMAAIRHIKTYENKIMM